MKRKAKYCGRGRGILCTASIAIPWLKETGGDSNPYCKRIEHIFLRVTTCTLSEKHPEPRAERMAPRIGGPARHCSDSGRMQWLRKGRRPAAVSLPYAWSMPRKVRSR